MSEPADSDHSTRPPRIVALVSGEGTNLQALIDAIEGGSVHARIAAVFSDRSDARALERARTRGIRAEFIGRKGFPDRAAFEAALAAAIAAEAPAAIVLAGFMRILGADFVRRFAGRLINVHPSLLPKFRGLDTHSRVLAAGDAWHGATVHFVTEALDAGPAIVQFKLQVRPSATPDELAKRVQAGEHRIVPQAADWLANGRLKLQGDRVLLDGQHLAEPVTLNVDD